MKASRTANIGWCLLGLMVVCASAGLQDPGFEWPMARAWLGPWGGGASGGQGGGFVVVAGPEDFIRAGRRSVRISLWGTASGEGAAWAGVTQVHPCSPGKKVLLGASVYASSTVHPLEPDTVVQLKVEYCSDENGGSTIAGAEFLSEPLTISSGWTPDAWRRIEAEDTAPENAHSLKLSVVMVDKKLGGERQSIWADEVVLDVEGFEPTVEGGEPPPPDPQEMPDVILTGGRFYREWERFWIKGVGYAPFRPGSQPSPGSLPPDDILREDMRRIKAAGFNTLRTWDDMPDPFYEIAAEFGLQVLTGVAVPLGDPSEPASREYAAEWVRGTVGRLRKHRNIIGYLLVNEPSPGLLEEAGEENMRAFYKAVAESAREMDPFRTISTTPWIILWYLDQPYWDVLCYNMYNYHPSAVETNLTYPRFVDYTCRNKALSRPLVITEFGYPVNPTGPGGLQYGGNSFEEQAQGIVDIFNWIAAGGAQGGCVFEWNDEWWKPNNTPQDEATHDNDPEEYYGLIAFKNRDDQKGSPRPAYYAVQELFQNFVVAPRDGEVFVGDVPVEVYRDWDCPAATYEYSVDGGPWKPLRQERSWWRAVVLYDELEKRMHEVSVRAKNADGHVLQYATRTVRFGVREASDRPQHSVSLRSIPEVPRPGEPFRFVVEAVDSEGRPVANYPVRLSILQTEPEADTYYEERTDTNGVFDVVYFPPRGVESSHVTAWASCNTMIGKNPTYAAADLSLLVGGAPERDAETRTCEMPRAGRAPVIDGTRDDVYGDEPMVDLSLYEGVMPDFLVMGRWFGNEDLSGQIRGVWDEEALYLIAEIRDVDPANNSYSDGDVWKGDGMEVFLGTDAAVKGGDYSSSDYQFILAPEHETWVYGQASGGTRNGSLKDVEMVTLSRQGGYVMEARIPWLNFAYKPEPGARVRVEFVLNGFVEGQGLPTKIVWATSGDAYRSTKNWGIATLAVERTE